MYHGRTGLIQSRALRGRYKYRSIKNLFQDYVWGCTTTIINARTARAETSVAEFQTSFCTHKNIFPNARPRVLFVRFKANYQISYLPESGGDCS